MFWIGCLTGYLIGTLFTFALICFTYKVGEMNKAEKQCYEIAAIEKSLEKEMEQLKTVRGGKDD
ncbi:hypothetical protein E0M25_12675 [Bacillus mycoides]|uniref:hypothetical protein n=1 Tax=Bacillus cereus group TaxID=86661 RepID=UPI00103AE162|nr:MULTISPECIES: hypothetical protein [Bacillus cereus group]MBJ8009609.1 hypothetical protein [Bacillus cereus]MBJ8190285.1 hypothetical protein [Bacillus cereus]MDM5460245.1 hypothetical protein [Bacillus cereus]QWG36866.1 hypothetical protein EXW30_29340 [Bacillus mycoides]QWG48296.1 hypothetical protein EXW31_29655 [Bacillus mycoides]